MQYTLRTIATFFSSSSIRVRRLLLAALLTGGFCSPGMAQDSPETPPAKAAKAAAGEWYTVTGRNVNIRCAPNISGSYSMGKLQKGDRVLVLNQNNGWAGIQTAGTSFKQVFGLLRADNKVKENGNMVEVLTTTPLLAPNVPTNNDPIRSWKQLLSLKPGTTLKVQKSFDNALDGTVNRWLLVQIPSTATVFVNMAFLAPENPSQTAPKPAVPTGTAPPAENIAPAAEVKTASTAKTSEAAATSTEKKDAVLVVEPAQQQAEKATKKVKDPEPSAATTTDVAFDPADGSPTGVKVKNLDPFTDVTIDQAEDAWKAMRSDGGADKEIETLQLIYTVIASDENASPESKRIAELRIRQLEMQRQVQDRLLRLKTIEQRNTVDRSRMQNAQILIEARAAYDAVGRINASRVYDGKRLPQLFRLQAPGGGRTIGYIRPNDKIDVLPMLGRLVGIVGPKNYDAGYRLLIVTPKRIDILTANADGE